MQYHLTVDLDLNHGTSTSLVSYDGEKVIQIDIANEMPNGFKSLGHAVHGFDIKQYVATHLDYDKFQFIDENGEYETVYLYDHSGFHLAELAKLEGSFAEHISAELKEQIPTHYEMEFVI